MACDPMSEIALAGGFLEACDAAPADLRMIGVLPDVFLVVPAPLALLVRGWHDSDLEIASAFVHRRPRHDENVRQLIGDALQQGEVIPIGPEVNFALQRGTDAARASKLFELAHDLRANLAQAGPACEQRGCICLLGL